MDRVNFLGTEVSRIILGDNPVNGHSYIPEYISEDDMLNYYSEERLIALYRKAASLGVTTLLPLANEFVLRALRHYLMESDASPQIIFQSHPLIDFQVNLRQMARFKPLGIYHQGTMIDCLCEDGKINVIKDRMKMIRDMGIKAGLCSHVPERIIRAEEEDWGCDFYMCCLHNTRKRMGTEQELSSFITGKPKHIKFFMEDRAEMLRVIAAVQKPCIAFKLFAGGQIFYGLSPEQIEEAVAGVYREVFGAIKPGDIAALGIFQRDKDQIGENIAIYERTMAHE